MPDTGSSQAVADPVARPSHISPFDRRVIVVGGVVFAVEMALSATAGSGHNSYYWWGPGNPRATTVVAVAPGPIDVTGYAGYLRQFFTGVQVAATLSNPDQIHNEEWHGHVYVCTGPRRQWGTLWPQLRHYS